MRAMPTRRAGFGGAPVQRHLGVEGRQRAIGPGAGAAHAPGSGSARIKAGVTPPCACRPCARAVRRPWSTSNRRLPGSPNFAAETRRADRLGIQGHLVVREAGGVGDLGAVWNNTPARRGIHRELTQRVHHIGCEQEAHLGRSAREGRDDVIVATKVGYVFRDRSSARPLRPCRGWFRARAGSPERRRLPHPRGRAPPTWPDFSPAPAPGCRRDLSAFVRITIDIYQLHGPPGRVLPRRSKRCSISFVSARSRVRCRT